MCFERVLHGMSDIESTVDQVASSKGLHLWHGRVIDR